MPCLEMGDGLILDAKTESIDLEVSIISLKFLGLGNLKCTTNETVYEHRYVKEDIFLCFKVNKSRYIALFMVSGSTKKLLSTDFVNIYLFSIFFSIDFPRWKSVRLPTFFVS